MDAGLAKVLNSTVGTSSLQSLDKVLDGVIEDVLTRNKSLVATDDTYYVFPTELQTAYVDSGTAGIVPIAECTMPADGSVNLLYKVAPSISSGTAQMYVYVNDVLYTTVTSQTLVTSQSDWSSLQIEFSKGDTIRVSVYRYASVRTFIYLRSLNATLISANRPDVAVLI